MSSPSFLSSLPPRFTACAAIALLGSACYNAPKYKHSNGNFAEWDSYEGRHFSPEDGIVTAIDPVAGTITIGGRNPKVLAVTPKTRIIHEGTDITLAQLPVNQEVKYTTNADETKLITVWYGTRLYQIRPAPIVGQ